jgi:hypothetical protein
MIGEYKIYKAKVVKVSIPNNEGTKQRRIYISPLHHTGMGPVPRDASPPTVLPTSSLGAGIISFPEVGQECLVAEYEGQRHIIGYTQPKGVTPYGMQAPEKLEEGTTIFKAAGIESAQIRIDKYGAVDLFSNTFAQMGVDGTLKKAYMKGYETYNEYAGGYMKNLYNKDTFSTPSTHVFTRFKDSPGFDDSRLRSEQTYESPLPIAPGTYKYADKAIIRSGFISGESIPYKIETRQGINQINSYDKTVVTQSRFGYQGEHTRYNEQNIAAGRVFELSAKKNFKKNVATYNLIWGKQQDTGEVYRFEIKEGLNSGVPFGSPVKDPMGEGKGWGYDPQSNAKEYFSESFGQLSDNSFLRRHVSSTFGQSDRFKVSEVYGSQVYYDKQVEFKDFKLKENYVSEDKLYFKEIAQNSIKLTETLSDNSYVFQYDEGDDTEVFSISNKKIELKSSDDVSITIEGKKITLKMQNSVLELTPTGMTYNGQPLAFGAFVDLVVSNSSTFTQGVPPGTPAPLFPATLAKINKQAAEPNTSSTALKTKI